MDMLATFEQASLALRGGLPILVPLMPDDTRQLVTLRTLRRMAEANTPFACLTAYDYTTAKWLARADVPVLLVGDTAAEMTLGLPGTIHCPLDVLLALTAAVKRGAPDCMVMGDMPFMSYQACESEAVRNAGRFLTDGRADVVKLEVDASWAPLVKKLGTDSQIVCSAYSKSTLKNIWI